jgi:precorrin-3B synthase
MESGDGLIVRVKPTGGTVSLGLARKIAGWSPRWGNGQIDLTSRANLQIRGVTEKTLQSLQEAMADAGLLDICAEAEAVRNVVASPLAGLDAHALLDIRPVVAALETRLVEDRALYALPPKFCWLVDDGGSASLDAVRADVRFEAVSASAFAVVLDGLSGRFGQVPVADVPDVAARIALAFLEHSVRRMRDVVDADLKALAGLAGAGRAQRRARGGRDGEPVHLRPPIACETGPSLSRLAGEPFFVALGLPFGRIGAGDLLDLVRKAAIGGATEFRLTPGRTILVPFPSEDAARHFKASLPLDRFILDADDPRRRVAACVGAPACPRATTDVRADAARLSSMVGVGELLHASGCAKGCAYPRAATITLVGKNGRYELIRNGAPWDMPEHTGLSLADLASALAKGHGV